MSTPTSAEGPLFELRAEAFAGRDLDVVEVRGREGMSRLFSFDVLFVTQAAGATLVSALLGRKARIVMNAAGADRRAFTGIVASIAPDDARRPDGSIGVRIRVVPRLWLLRRRKHSRIFQDLTVREIVTRVLDALDIPCAWRLEGVHAPKEYCVQYQETDHDFVTRLLAEEGIYYHFEPASGIDGAADDALAPDVVVFGDHAGYGPIDGEDAGDGCPSLAARPADGLGTDLDWVTAFTVRRRLRSTAVLLKDFDHERPSFALESTAAISGKGKKGEDPDSAEGARPDALRVYEHAGDYHVPEVSAARAQITLEKLRRRAVVARGESRCRRLAAGRRFLLRDHPIEEHNREYVVTRVDHVGRVPERLAGRGDAPVVYENTFECAPADVVYRPRRAPSAPRQVLETAIVVGPGGEEIYTDALGRIKVQFHWDLDGRSDAHSSCWLRVSQAWAGTGWGFQFIPRIGMEVLVSFLSGDTDRPVAIGCLANPLSPPSHHLPTHATRSGIRTRTVPGPDGHNEISFEDRRGNEVVHVHAQRDMHVVVREDQTITVGGLGDAGPSGDQRTNVAANQVIHVGVDRSLAVAGDLAERVAGTRSEVVLGGATRTIHGPSEERCEDTLVQRVAQSQLHVIGDALTREVGGDTRVRTGGDRAEIVGGSASLVVTGDVSHATRGAYAVSSMGGVVLTSAESIRLVCGGSMIELGPEEITLSSKAITIAADATTSLFAPGTSLVLERNKAELAAAEVVVAGKGAEVALKSDAAVVAGKKEVKLFSKGASVVLDSDAAMDGGKVKLNCGASSGGEFDEPDETEASFIDIVLLQKMPKPGDPTALEDAPVPGARFVVEVSDGRKFRGTLDESGKARVPVPKGPAKVSFPDYDAGRVEPG